MIPHLFLVALCLLGIKILLFYFRLFAYCLDLHTAFETLLLPHQYDLWESSDVSIYETVLIDGSEAFGGASVTIPHKESIIPYLDEIRGAASMIGAVNTIVPEYAQMGWAG